jgi:hypothetical protein
VHPWIVFTGPVGQALVVALNLMMLGQDLLNTLFTALPSQPPSSTVSSLKERKGTPVGVDKEAER